MTFSDSDQSELRAVLQKLNESGIERIVALRGDAVGIDQKYAFESTLEFIQFAKGIADFDISVAAYPEGHPEAKTIQQDIDFLKAKLDIGVDRAITQFCFDPEIFLRFRDRLQTAGIEQPVIPGILPIQDFEKAARFARDCGADYPRLLCSRL